jgi:RNA polymerase sigma factor (sigma-70 family)
MTEVVLHADEHFEALREPVWSRFRTRHGAGSRDRFEEAYAEFWLRELERAAAGRPSRAAAPVAFVTEAINRVVIDHARSRARGLARDEKHTLELQDIDDQSSVASDSDTASRAEFEALVHLVLDAVRSELTARELQVFVSSFLYLRSTPQTAAALGLSEPRVKKDRVRILAKVGAAVWPIMAGELGCPASASGDAAAGFELMASHVEECQRCAGLRAGALAVVGPVELLALAQGGLLDHLGARLYDTAHRVGEFVAAVPPAGRGAAVAGLAAAALVSGAATARTADPHDARPAPVAPAIPVARSSTPEAASVTQAVRAPTVRPRPASRRARKEIRHRPQPRATAAATPLRAPPELVATPTAPIGSGGGTGEFGFEQD